MRRHLILIKQVEDVNYKGCLTCGAYNPLPGEENLPSEQRSLWVLCDGKRRELHQECLYWRRPNANQKHR